MLLASLILSCLAIVVNMFNIAMLLKMTHKINVRRKIEWKGEQQSTNKTKNM